MSGENDTHYYYIQNGHGDVVRMMDTSGNMVNSYTYDPYGVVMSQTEGTYNPFKYAGELQNMPDNLIYLRNRIYDPKIGRFLTEDPIKDGTNWYVYCNNNPVNYWDPLGLIRAPGFNAKGEWSNDPDADDFGKDSAKYNLLVVLGYAWYAADVEDRDFISYTANNVRKFDDETIEKAYYLNDSDGAGSSGLYAGHAAVLLVNDDGHGILFSYFPQDSSDLFYSPSEMRVQIFLKAGKEDLLEGGYNYVVSSTGEIRRGKYDRYIEYDITKSNGEKMMDAGVNYAKNNPKYHLIYHNCDHVAVDILNSGGVKLEKEILPSSTYKVNKN